MEERKKERMKSLTRNLEVCDLLDVRNPQSVAEYAPQIYLQLQKEELLHQYPKDFMKNQTIMTENMRSYCVDWLYECMIKLKLWHETFHVCVGVMDKFLAVYNIQREEEF